MCGQLHILIVLSFGLLLAMYFSTLSLQAVFISRLVQSKQFQLGPRSIGAIRNVHIGTITELASENCISGSTMSIIKVNLKEIYAFLED
jgi:hypothetical protein